MEQVTNKALEVLEANKYRQDEILDKNIIESALIVELTATNRGFGLIDLAVIQSLVLQLKQKVKHSKSKGFYCPRCESMRFWRDGHYCKSCGQHLDWEFEEVEDGEQKTDSTEC